MTCAGPQQTIICRLDDLQDPGSRGGALRDGDQLLGVFVVRSGQNVYAYLNRCPHTGSPLDWNEHEFLSLDRSYIQCAMHAARFRLTDGVCVAGPCAGASLSPLHVEVESGLVIVSHATQMVHAP